MSEPDDFNSNVIKIILAVTVVGFCVYAVPRLVAARNTSAKNACINNLRQSDGAKQQWALENRKDTNAIPTASDVANYLKNNTFPVCPHGGKYIVGRVWEDPRCTYPGDVLPTP
jgi:hypothetical protein